MSAWSRFRTKALLASAPFFGLIAMACSGGVVDLQEPVVIGTAADLDIALRGDGEWVSGGFTFVVENQGPQLIRVNDCGVSIERLDGFRWVLVWQEVCALDDSSFTQLDPGMTHSHIVTVDAELGRYPAEGWRAPVEGQYRARMIVRGLDDSARAVPTGSFFLP